MNIRLITIFAVFVLVLVALGVWVGAKLGAVDPSGPSRYSAVYLTTGDVYFGKLKWFPWPHLTRVWLLQRTVDAQNQVSFRIVPLTDAFWKPVSELYLNPKQVIFWTRLQKASDVACVIENQENPERCSRDVPQPQGAPQLPFQSQLPTQAMPATGTLEPTNPLVE